MFSKNAIKIILALVILTFALNSSLAGDFKLMNHVSEGSVAPDWMPESYTQNITFTITNNISSVDNVLALTISNTNNSGIDPFNISHLYCPIGFTSKISEGDTTVDNIFDKAECTNGNVTNGSTINVVLTVTSRDLVDKTIYTNPWTVSTHDFTPSFPWDSGFTATLGIDAKGTTNNFTDLTSVIGNGNHTITVNIVEAEVQINDSSDAIADHVDLTGVCEYTTLYSPNLTCSSDKKTCNYSFIIDASKNNITEDGICTVNVFFEDTFGNKGINEKNYTVDNTGPVITLVSHNNGSEIKAGDIINFTITDTPANVDLGWWSNNGGVTNYTFIGGIYEIDSTGWTDGLVIINVWSNDTLGNVDDTIYINSSNDTLDNITVIVDNIAPNVTINSPTQTYYGASIFVNVIATDVNTVNTVQARWEHSNGTTGSWVDLTDDGTYWTGNINSTNLLEINYTVRVNAIDNATNSNSTQTVTNVAIDHANPLVINITSPTNGASFEAVKTFTVTAAVNDSVGVDYCSVSVDSVVTNIAYNTTTGECSGLVGAPNAAGTYPVYVTVHDLAGNTDTDSVNIDVFVVTGPGGSGSSSSGGFVPLNVPVENEQPDLSAPHIDSETPTQGETITCISGEFSDADGDSNEGNRWRWFVNDKEVYVGSKNTFDTSDVEVGDEITCSQRATDGIDYSEWADSKNSAVVQAPEEQIVEENVVEEEPTVTNPFTGAFIGGILNDNIATTILLVTIFGGAGAIFIVRRIKGRKLKFKLG